MMTVLNSNRFYCSTIKTMSLMLLASCAIHAADNGSNSRTDLDPFMVSAMSTHTTTTTTSQHDGDGHQIPSNVTSSTSPHTTTTMTSQHDGENSCIQELPPELLAEILRFLDLSTMLRVSQTSKAMRDKTLNLGIYPYQIKEKAEKNIDDIFADHTVKIKDCDISLANTIKNAFSAHDIRCIKTYRSCGVMTAFPSADLTDFIVKKLNKKSELIFPILVYHDTIFPRNIDSFTRQMKNILKKFSLQGISEFLPTIKSYVSPIFKMNMKPRDICWIIEALSPLSPQQIIEFMKIIIDDEGQLSNKIFRKNMEGYHTSLIIKNLARLSPKSIEEFMDAIVANEDQLFRVNTDPGDRSRITAILTLRSPEDIQTLGNALKNHASNLFKSQKKLNEKNRSTIITALSALNTKELNDFLNNGLNLFTTDMAVKDRVSLILGYGDVSERMKIVFGQNIYYIFGQQKSRVPMSVGGDLPRPNAIQQQLQQRQLQQQYAQQRQLQQQYAQQRQLQQQYAQRQIPNAPSFFSQNTTDIFLKLSVNAQRNISNHAAHFFPEGMTQNDMCSILGALASLSDVQVSYIGDNAHRLFPIGMDVKGKIKLIQHLALLSPKQIAEYARNLTCAHASTSSFSQSSHLAGHKRPRDHQNECESGDDEGNNDKKRHRPQ